MIWINIMHEFMAGNHEIEIDNCGDNAIRVCRPIKVCLQFISIDLFEIAQIEEKCTVSIERYAS